MLFFVVIVGSFVWGSTCSNHVSLHAHPQHIKTKLGGFGHDKFVPIGSGQVASLSNGSVVVNTVFKVVGTWNACNSAITVVSCFT